MRKQRPGSDDIRANSRWTHDKKRADGHASDLPERTSRHPSLHLTAPYAIPPLSCGNTLQPGAARGVASWPLPPDTEEDGGSTPPAPTTASEQGFCRPSCLADGRDRRRGRVQRPESTSLLNQRCSLPRASDAPPVGRVV